MRALKVIILVLLLLAALFLIMGLFLSKSAYTEKSIEINAPASMIFNQVNHLPNWEKWSPYSESDPEMAIVYGEILSGEGASYSWTSMQGNGSMIIRESIPYERIVFDMEFIGQDNAYSTWTFQEMDGKTLVTWGFGMDSLSYPLSRYFGLFLGSMMRPSLDKGLKNLRDVVEAMDLEPMGRTGEIEERVIEDQFIISIKDSCMADELESFFEHSFSHMFDFLSAQGLEMKAPVMSIWHSWNPEGHSLVEAAIPVDRLVTTGDPSAIGIVPRILKGGKVVYATHFGDQASSGMTYEAIEAHLDGKGYAGRGDVWEIYISHRATEPDPSKWEFQIVYPIK